MDEIDQFQVLAAAIKNVAASDALRSQALDLHMHRHIDEVTELAAEARATAVVAVVYCVVAFGVLWLTSQRIDRIESHLRELGGAVGTALNSRGAN